MKRLFLLFLLLCVFSNICYAQLKFEFFGGVPLAWDRGKIFGYDANAQTTSLSFGLGIKTPINNRVEFGSYNEFFFPQKLTISINGEKTSVERKDYDTLLGMSVLLGPVFYLHSDLEGKFKIPLITGIRWMWLAASTEYAMVFGNNFGLQAGIGTEFKVSENIFIFGRLMTNYDFYSFSMITVSGFYTTNTETISGFINSFGLTPHIGMGLSINRK